MTQVAPVNGGALAPPELAAGFWRRWAALCGAFPAAKALTGLAASVGVARIGEPLREAWPG